MNPEYSRREVAAILLQWATPDQHRRLSATNLDKSLETDQNHHMRWKSEKRDMLTSILNSYEANSLSLGNCH